MFSDNDPTINYQDRRLASSKNRNLWHKFRIDNVTATDIASLSTEKSIPSVAQSKLTSNFAGNAYTAHGNKREPVIAAWIKRTHKVAPNDFLYYAQEQRRHLATPDGLSVINGELVLSEIKTTNKPFPKIPIKYLRQIYWQQYVLGASRTLFVWEEHKNFIPLKKTPEFIWVDRDEKQIQKLVTLADLLLEYLDNVDKEQLITSQKPTQQFIKPETDINHIANSPFNNIHLEEYHYEGLETIEW